MTTMREACDSVRSRLYGSLPQDISLLQGNYVPNTGTVALQIAKPKVPVGATCSVGLNTFLITAIDSGGATFTVTSIDGTEAACPNGEKVFFRSPTTTKAIFRELQRECSGMSTPGNGLYRPAMVEYQGMNYYDQTYQVPTDWTTDPLRVLVAEVLIYGHQAVWVPVRSEWQPNQGIVTLCDPVEGSKVRITFAMPFVQPADLDTTFEEVGISYWAEDIPTLGACANLSIGFDGRRANPSAQPDTRRAQEISQGGGANLAQSFLAQKNLRIREERARLNTLYPARWPR